MNFLIEKAKNNAKQGKRMKNTEKLPSVIDDVADCTKKPKVGVVTYQTILVIS